MAIDCTKSSRVLRNLFQLNYISFARDVTGIFPQDVLSLFCCSIDLRSRHAF
jgi:hypothetical protein